MSAEELLASEATCMALIPQEDEEPWVPEQVYAEDAVSALAYAVRTGRTSDSREAAWAARCAYDSLDHFVINHENIDTNIAGAERRVQSHPLVQAELRRQANDLQDLLDDGGAPGNLVARIRARANADAGAFFGAMS
jgi:hypothetical protein